MKQAENFSKELKTEIMEESSGIPVTGQSFVFLEEILCFAKSLAEHLERLLAGIHAEYPSWIHIGVIKIIK